MEELQEFSEKEESNFDLKAEIYKYLSHWKWLVFGSLLGLALAYLYNRYTIPVFESEATMMILSDDPGIASALPSGASILTFDNSTLDNQIVTLRSKQLVETVIDELNLNITYFNEGNVIAVEAYKNSSVVIDILTPDSLVHGMDKSFFITPLSKNKFVLTEEGTDFSQTYQFGEVVSREGLDFSILPRGGELGDTNVTNIRITPLREVANHYISNMVITPKGSAKDILSLAITGEEKEKSEDFLDALMRHFNLDGMADKRQVAESTAKFIQRRLELISEELDSVEGGIADFKRENQLMDVSSSAGEFMAKSSMAEQEIFRIETQKLVINSIKEVLTSAEPYTLLPAGLGIEDAGISSLIGTYNTLVLERDASLTSATEKNPVVEALTQQLNSLRRNLLDNIASTLKSLDIELRELNQLEQYAEGQFSTFPGLEKGIRSIERQQEIKEQLYLFLLQRREESAISFAATSPVAKVIDPAYSGNNPVDPKPWLILVGGFVVGLLIPLLVIFVMNFLDTKVHHKGDLNPLIKNIPFLGEIPLVTKESPGVIELNDRSPLAESFRILRTNLAYLVQSRNREKGEVIFVTSTIKGEGKTFVSFNMARTLASTKKRVLLIGADIRNPKLHKYSGENLETKGLSDYLYNYDLKPSDIILTSDEGGIYNDLILSGAIPPNPAELFMNDRMKSLLEEVVRLYDYIIVDTAPTMIVTDTLLISPLADTTLYVVRAGYTEKKLLDFPKDLKQQGKIKGLAIILNDVDYSKFSYGAKYGYAYGYGYGYGADKEKVSLFKRLFK